MLFDDVRASLPAMRRDAESLMTLTLAWFSPEGTKTVVNGMEERTPRSEGSTPGKVQGPSSQTGDSDARMVSVGGSDRPVVSAGVHIPLSSLLASDGSLRLVPGWECRVTAVRDLADSALLGRRFRVVDVPVKSYATARRLDVVDVTHLGETVGAVAT